MATISPFEDAALPTAPTALASEPGSGPASPNPHPPNSPSSNPQSHINLTVAAQTQSRKADHIRICLDDRSQCQTTTTGLERYRFTHCALPDLNYDDIDLSSQFLGKALGAPILISSMTGGTIQAQEINRSLAAIAQKYRLAMGVGSQRVAVENPALMETFEVRAIAPIFYCWPTSELSSSTTATASMTVAASWKASRPMP